MNLQNSAIKRLLKAASLVQRRLQIGSAPTLIRIVTQSQPVRRSRATVASEVSQVARSELELEEKAAMSCKLTALPISFVLAVTATLQVLGTYSKLNNVSK